MSFRPQDLYDFAEEMMKSNPLPEMRIRTAINRAYYAAYHDCKDWYDALPDTGHVPVADERKGTHAKFFAKLENPGDRLTTEQKAESIRRGRRLRRMHADRVTADYHQNSNVSQGSAAILMTDARNILAGRI
ncbi:hypothetical protein [Acidovorax sp. Root219]|uniref:hypothetical protein n=1 Tax=Acidovorax sp. Root219 TaxID=1736493 RepID=UPI00070C3BE7|nr:hypothetical protein [Acidovorax sp. Root219]KRC34374.1 hypothetical protein ASE28_08450 [Acidovorax sp. Root219]